MRWLIALIAFPSCWASQTASLIPDYTAEYKVYFHGVLVGKSKQQLLSYPGNHYHFSVYNHSQLPMIQHLFTECSSGQYTNHYRADTYRYQYNHQKGHYWVAYDFDWDHNSVTAEVDKRAKQTIPLDGNTFDRISHQLQLRLELIRNPSLDTMSYQLLEFGIIKPYHYLYSGTETIDTPKGSYACKVFERHHKNRTTKLWLAPDEHYLPIKVTHQEQDRTPVTAILDNLRFEEAITTKLPQVPQCRPSHQHSEDHSKNMKMPR